LNAQSENQSGYMLLFIGTDWHKGLSPEQMQNVSADWMAWFKRLTEQGRAVAGHPLDEAVAIAKQCPGLPYGAKVEVRAVRAQCPLKTQAEEQMAEAVA
jgi:hypothetical protein